MIGMFAVHTVTVRTKTGQGSYGPVYAAGETVEGVMVDETTRLVRTSDGSEQVSSTTVYDPQVSRAAKFAVGSRVTLPSGDETTVLSRSVHSFPGLGLPEHVEAACA